MDNHNQQERDFLSIFSNDQQQPHMNNMFSMPYNQHHHSIQPSIQSNVAPQLSMDVLNNLMTIQGLDPQSTSPALLEHQYSKLTQLQQLQQLQNQIFQQQMALISSQTPGIMQHSPSIEPRRDPPNQFQGLLTPGPSAEIQAQQPPVEYVSPMILNNSYMDQEQHFRQNNVTPMNVNTNFTTTTATTTTTAASHPRGSTSAPEHLAFRTNLPSPADLDFDISPLTSPWLGAHQHQHATNQLSSSSSPSSNHNNNTNNSTNKRNASSSGDEANGRPSRKKQSPAGGNHASSGGTTKKIPRGSRSTNSTPLMRSTGRGGRSAVGGEVPGDTPSPVDLSMPPPAPPGMAATASSSSSSSRGGISPSSPQFNPHLTPVTPASIMNLTRLGINNNNNNNHHTHSGAGADNNMNHHVADRLTPMMMAQQQQQQQGMIVKLDMKGKASSTAAAAAAAAGGGGGMVKLRTTESLRGKSASRARAASGGSVMSPNLKAILPAGSGPHHHSIPHTSSPSLSHLQTTVPITTTSTSTSASTSSSTSTSTSTPGIQVRKTSHKAAEQKRRDSLKTTFDDLRVLLPPIPLPTDDKYPVDEILPGALPPRGPPKAGGEGPNKGVSKLQLLMAGNEYIRTLKGRVERRDEEIERLRREVGRLRLLGGGGGGCGTGSGTMMLGEEGGEGEEEIDLEKDLDAVEVGGMLCLGMGGTSSSHSGVGMMPTVGEDEGDDDPGDD